MERPSSRGSLALSSAGVAKAPTGAPIQQPDRPMTGSRAPAGPALGPSIMAPGTAMRGGAPPGTAYKRVTAGALAKGSPQVDARPLTQQGVGGAKPATQAAGRQVLDRSYFLSELRQKRAEIVSVTQHMQEEMDTLSQRQAAYARADKRQAELAKEVRALQESLTDHNLVIDKVSSHTPVHAISAERAMYAQRNEGQRYRVEGLITERLALEAKTKQLEARAADIQAASDARLAAMAPSMRQQHAELTAEQASLTAEAARFEEAASELDSALAAAEGELARNTLKQRAVEFQEQIRVLSERKYELQADEERSKQSPEEQREALMARIKRDNAELDRATAAIKELQEETRRLEGRLAAVGAADGGAAGSGAADSSAAAQAEEATRREKFAELLTRERELLSFMDAFPQMRDAKTREVEARQDDIVRTLEGISKLRGLVANEMPSKGQFQEMQDELEYKKQHLQSAATTQEALGSELADRRAELDKIDGLGGKIASELEALQSKSAQLQEELVQLGQVEEARGAAEAKKAELEAKRLDLLQRRDAVKADVADKTFQQQAKEGQLREHPSWAQLDRLEQQLKALNAGIQEASEYIQAREAESNWQGLASNITVLADEVNAAVIAALPA